MANSSEDQIKSLEARVAQLEKLLQQKTGRSDDDLMELGKIGPQELPSEVAMSTTRVVMHHVVLPSMADDLGFCFGGQVLSWIDICAGLATKNAARGACVTASVDAVHFLQPCRAGCVAIICGMVNRTFSTSMEVGVRVEAEDVRTGTRQHCCSAYLTFVSLKARKKIGGQLLPQLIPSSPVEIEAFEGAQSRRQARLEKRKLLKSDEKLAQKEALSRLLPVHQQGGPILPPAIRIDPAEMMQTREAVPSLTTAHMTQLIMPQHANSLGITFGGQVLSWMEECVIISASRLRGGYLVTAGVDTMTFAKPTKVGHILYISSQVSAVFGASMEVMVTVYGEDPADGDTFHCADAFFTVVCVDSKGRPSKIPVILNPETEAEEIRHAGASNRREARVAERDQILTSLPKKRSLDGHILGEI